MSDSGWFPAYRRMYEPGHWLAPTARDPSNRRDAWSDLLQMATYQPRETRRAGRIERGELLVSLRTLSRRWKWEKRKVERFMSGLRMRTAIETLRETPDGTVYRIVNYESYAIGAEVERDTNQDTKRDSGETAARQEQEGKKVRRRKTPSGDLLFEEAFQIYPDRQGGNPKAPALRAWSARIKEGVDPVELVEGVKRYRRYIEDTGKLGSQFVKMPATFLGPDEHWKLPYSVDGRYQEDATGIMKRHEPPPVDDGPEPTLEERARGLALVRNAVAAIRSGPAVAPSIEDPAVIAQREEARKKQLAIARGGKK